MTDVTRILSQLESADPSAAEQLLPLVYDELRRLAAARLEHEKPGQTLSATALVHEAYVRLIGPADPVRWNNRGHFFSAAATAMRRILIERARRKQRKIHGGGRQRQEFDPDLAELKKRTEALAVEIATQATTLDDLNRRKDSRALRQGDDDSRHSGHRQRVVRCRGLNDIFIVCVDGLTGFPEAIEAVYPQAKVQLCIVHLVRAALKYVVDQQRDSQIHSQSQAISQSRFCHDYRR